MEHDSAQPELFEYIPPAYIEVVALILIKYINNKTHILISERVKPINRYVDTLPAGKVENKETKEEATIREVRQETGLKLFGEEYLISALVTPIVVFPYRITYFFTFIDEATPDENIVNIEPEKHQEWEWITLQQLENKILQGKYPDILRDSWWVEEIRQYEDDDWDTEEKIMAHMERVARVVEQDGQMVGVAR